MTNTNTDQTVSDHVPEKSGSIFDVRWNETNEAKTTASYRSISVLAILALCFGLLSLTVLIHWGLAFVPIIAVMLALTALYSIKKSEGALFGAAFAYIGLFCAVFSCVAYVAIWETYKYNLVHESIPFAKSYVEFLTNEYDLVAIQQYERPYWLRTGPPYDKAWEEIAKSEFGQESIQSVASDTCRRTLMALKGTASVTFYKIKAYQRDQKNDDYVAMTLAVTYPVGEKKETFFVDVTLQRFVKEDDVSVDKKKEKHAGWAVKSLSGPVLPKEFGGVEKKKT